MFRVMTALVGLEFGHRYFPFHLHEHGHEYSLARRLDQDLGPVSEDNGLAGVFCAMAFFSFFSSFSFPLLFLFLFIPNTYAAFKSNRFVQA